MMQLNQLEINGRKYKMNFSTVTQENILSLAASIVRLRNSLSSLKKEEQWILKDAGLSSIRSRLLLMRMDIQFSVLTTTCLAALSMLQWSITQLGRRYGRKATIIAYWKLLKELDSNRGEPGTR